VKIEKIRSDRWVLDYRKKQPDGLLKRVRRGFKTRTLAEQYAGKITQRLKLPEVERNPTLHQLAEDYYKLARYADLAPSTKRRYRENIDGFLSFCDKHRLHYVTEFTRDWAKEYEGYVYKLWKGKGRTHRLTVAAMLFLEELDREKPCIGKSPFTRIRKSPESSRRTIPRFFSLEELARLREHMSAEECAIFDFLYHTGLRTGELLGLEWNYVFEDRIHIKQQWRDGEVRRVKGKEDRVIPLTNKAKECLVLFKTHSDGTVVLPARTRISHHYILRSFDRIKKLTADTYPEMRAALTTKDPFARATPHTYRKTFASHMLQAGAPIKSVSDLLGHSSVAITEKHYGALVIGTLKDSIDLLETKWTLGWTLSMLK
jgi:integrase